MSETSGMKAGMAVVWMTVALLVVITTAFEKRSSAGSLVAGAEPSAQLTKTAHDTTGQHARLTETMAA